MHVLLILLLPVLCASVWSSYDLPVHIMKWKSVLLSKHLLQLDLFLKAYFLIADLIPPTGFRLPTPVLHGCCALAEITAASFSALVDGAAHLLSFIARFDLRSLIASTCPRFHQFNLEYLQMKPRFFT